MGTAIIYFVFIVLCCLAAYKAEQTQKIKYAWILAVLLTLLAGLRAYTVGIDTANYLKQFYFASQGYMNLIYSLELGYEVLLYVLSHIFYNPTFFLLMLAGLTNFLIIRRLWDFQPVSSFLLMSMAYVSYYYFLSFNNMRQMLCVAISFFATRYIGTKQRKWALILILLAATLHKSALIVLILLPLTHIRDIKRLVASGRFKYWKYIILSVLIVAMAFLILRYKHYFLNIQINFGLMLPFKLLFVTAMVYYLRKSPIRDDLILQDNRLYLGVKDPAAILSAIVYLGILLSMSGYFFIHTERIGWYFLIYEPIYYGLFIKRARGKAKSVFLAIIILLLVYAFFSLMRKNAQGQIPYQFFFLRS